MTRTFSSVRAVDQADPIAVRDATVAQLQALTVPGHSLIDAGGMDTVTSEVCDCGLPATVVFAVCGREVSRVWHEKCPDCAFAYLDTFTVHGDHVDVEVHLAGVPARLAVAR